MIRKVVFFVLLIAVVVPLLVSSIYSFSSPADHARLYNWQYRWGESPVHTSGMPLWTMQEDDLGWQPADKTVNLPGRNGEKELWLRAQLPDRYWRDPSLALQAYNAFEVYTDEGLIYRFGDAGGDYRSMTVKLVAIPESAKGQMIYFRVLSVSKHIGLFGEIFVSSHEDQLLNIVQMQWLRIFLGLVYIVGAFVCFYIYLRMDQKLLIYFTMFLLLIGSFVASQTVLSEYIWDNAQFWTIVEVGSLMNAVGICILILEQLTATGTGRSLKRLGEAHLYLAGAAILAFLFSFIRVHIIVQMYELFLIVTIFWVIAQLMFRVKSGNKDVWTVLYGAASFAIVGLVEITTNWVVPQSGNVVFIHLGVLGIVAAMISVLVRRMTNMLTRLGNTEKLSLAGQLAAEVAHEIRNPITVISGYLQLMRKKEEHPEKIDLMLSEVNRINQIINEFLFLAKPGKPKYKEYMPDQIIEDVVTLLEAQANDCGVKIMITGDELLPAIHCDENQFKQVMLNLLKNAIEAMPYGGTIIVEINRIRTDKVAIRIIDQGIGLSYKQIKRLGDPFFTTKENGTGLGLMVSRKIIENHNGTLEITSKENKGTIVEVILPYGRTMSDDARD